MRRSRRPGLRVAAGLGGDEAEHGTLALGHEAQRPKVAGALAVVLQEEDIDRRLVEQLLRHGLVAARRHPAAAEVAAAQVQPERHAGRAVGGDAPQKTEIGVEQRRRLAALGRRLPTHLGVAQHRDRAPRRAARSGSRPAPAPPARRDRRRRGRRNRSDIRVGRRGRRLRPSRKKWNALGAGMVAFTTARRTCAACALELGQRDRRRGAGCALRPRTSAIRRPGLRHP